MLFQVSSVKVRLVQVNSVNIILGQDKSGKVSWFQFISR